MFRPVTELETPKKDIARCQVRPLEVVSDFVPAGNEKSTSGNYQKITCHDRLPHESAGGGATSANARGVWRAELNSFRPSKFFKEAGLFIVVRRGQH
jgi:hypothetical protein